jgi:hypothetical protein
MIRRITPWHRHLCLCLIYAELQAIVEAVGSGVVWNYLTYEPPVIPAKLVLREGGGAGIQPVEMGVPESLRSGFPPSRE